MVERRLPGGTARTRLAAAGSAAVTVALGLGVRAVVGGEVGKCAGDALYTVLVYALVVLAGPRVRPGTAACVASAVSWAVEFLQLSDLPARLARRSVLARLVLGSTFHAPDLAWYVVGAGCAWVLHAGLRRAAAGQTPPV